MIRLIAVICVTVLITSFKFSDSNSFSYQEFCDYYSVSDSTRKSKAILIEFWASWCQPCRKINGEISELHQEYSHRSMTIGKGLNVIFVALDDDSLRWSKSIKNDRIEWAQHVRDTAKWNSAFLTKNRISYLPMNYLLDSSGNVLAQGLYGDHLQEKLESYCH